MYILYRKKNSAFVNDPRELGRFIRCLAFIETRLMLGQISKSRTLVIFMYVYAHQTEEYTIL
jgi:hypothetical protein